MNRNSISTRPSAAPQPNDNSISQFSLRAIRDRDVIAKKTAKTSLIIIAIAVVIVVAYSIYVAQKKRQITADTNVGIENSCSPSQAQASGYMFGAEGIPMNTDAIRQQAKQKALDDFNFYRIMRENTQDDFINGMEEIIVALAKEENVSPVVINGETFQIPSLARATLYRYPRFMFRTGPECNHSGSDHEQPGCLIPSDSNAPTIYSRGPYIIGGWSPADGYWGLDIPLGDPVTNTVIDGHGIARADSQLAINRSLIGNTLNQFLQARLAFEASKPIVTVNMTERKGGVS